MPFEPVSPMALVPVRPRHPLLMTGIWGGLAVLGLVAWVASLLGGDPARAWRAMLASFVFFTPMAAAMVTWTAVVMASNGAWAGFLERLAAAGLSFAPVSVVALAALWISAGQWAPWMLEKPAHDLWLSRTYLFGRDMALLIGFWAMAAYYIVRRRQCRAEIAAPILIVVYCGVFSMLGFDLIMALVPTWRSELFGGYFFISGMYAAVAAWALRSAWQPSATKNQLQDFGKLITAFCMLTTYCMYSQLLPIWYENLPEETNFLVPRFNFGPWNYVSLALVAVIYVGPIALLLFVRAKRSRLWLGMVCLLVLAGLWVERWWLVMASLSPHAPLGLAELGGLALFAGAFGLGLDVFGRWLPLVYEPGVPGGRQPAAFEQSGRRA